MGEARRRRQAITVRARNTGVQQPVPEQAYGHDVMATIKPGEHLWTMVAVWRIVDPASAFDPAQEKYLDTENLLSLDGPGCFVCEEPYTPERAARPCPGDPAEYR